MSRTNNSIRNVKYAIIGQGLALIISFIARMIFVKTLGAEYLGINGLFTNILSILAFAELGIGTAITYSLYKPLAEKDIEQTKTLMRLFQKAYLTIGIIILILGTGLTPFLGYLIKDMPDIENIPLIYLMFVVNSAISYFYSYKRSIIIADQKHYIDTIYRYGFRIVLEISQIIVLILTQNFIMFLALQFIMTFLQNIGISKKADKLYPYIKDKNVEKLDTHTKNTIVRNVKALIYHKVGSIVVMGTDNLLISKYVGIVAVGIYSNYYLIIGAVNTVSGVMFQAVTASVGNLGVTATKERKLFVFECLNFITFWIYGFSAISLIILFNPFIEIWLGEEYLFSMLLTTLIVLNFYISSMRKSVLTFREALGLYWYDRYKPLFEAGINLIVSVILVKMIGIAGIFIGTFISTITTCFWVEPYILYKYGFKHSVKTYFLRYFTYTVTILIAGVITWYLCETVEGTSILALILKIIISILVPNTIFVIVYSKTKEFKYFKNLFKTKLKIG
jgi:O-antigen/teichoic acid export membrane protein